MSQSEALAMPKTQDSSLQPIPRSNEQMLLEILVQEPQEQSTKLSTFQPIKDQGWMKCQTQMLIPLLLFLPPTARSSFT
jgi:hypothetical protein